MRSGIPKIATFAFEDFEDHNLSSKDFEDGDFFPKIMIFNMIIAANCVRYFRSEKPLGCHLMRNYRSITPVQNAEFLHRLQSFLKGIAWNMYGSFKERLVPRPFPKPTNRRNRRWKHRKTQWNEESPFKAINNNHEDLFYCKKKHTKKKLKSE